MQPTVAVTGCLRGGGTSLPTRRVTLGARGDPAASFFMRRSKYPICDGSPEAFGAFLSSETGRTGAVNFGFSPPFYLTATASHIRIGSSSGNSSRVVTVYFFIRLGCELHEHSIGDESHWLKRCPSRCHWLPGFTTPSLGLITNTWQSPSLDG